jgi:hypothetical protein
MCLRFFSNLTEMAESILETLEHAHVMLVAIDERLSVLDDLRNRIQLIDIRFDRIEKWQSQHEILLA